MPHETAPSCLPAHAPPLSSQSLVDQREIHAGEAPGERDEQLNYIHGHRNGKYESFPTATAAGTYIHAQGFIQDFELGGGETGW